MAPSSHEAVKSILADVSKFVSLTLKSESLSKKAESERIKLVEALEKFFADNYSLAPHSGDEGSTSSHKTPSISGSIEDSKNTVDSHGSEEDYDDNIPSSNVKSLENATKYGYLDYKKQKDGQILPSSWQKKRYFVFHKRIMYCFKKPSDQKQTCAFLVSGYEFHESPQHTKDSKRKECCFELIMPGKKSHQFLADSKEDLQAWKEVLQATLQADASSSREDLVAEEDEDLYEPLPGEAVEAGIGQISPKVETQIEKVAPVQIKLEEADAEEAEEEDIYAEGTSEEAAPPTPAAPQSSPSNKTGVFFKKLFKRKESDSVEKKEKVEEVKPKEQEAEQVSVIDEFQEDEDIYEEFGTDTSHPPQPPRPVPSPVPAPPVNTKKEEPPPQTPSITSATQAPTNVPKLPSRGPVPPPNSPTPALPPRVPPSSQPPPLPDRDLPPLPDRDLPPLPERDLPPLPERDLPPLPPLPERSLPPRPPNIPVPPVPSELSSTPKDSQTVQPELDKSIGRPREEDFENLYYSAYTCHGASDLELTFTRGDLIHVISRDLEPHNWWVGELSGRIGLVPKTYLVSAFTEVN